MAIEKDVLDQLLAGRDPQEVFAKDGLVDELKKALSERILNAELDEHLGEERAEGSANRRNGSSQKTVLSGTSKMRLTIPRDRAGTFDPKLIAKHQRRFPDFDDKIISMYARGMSVREIRGHLEELYGIDGSPDLISAVTDAVLEEVAEWQNRPLEACYPLVFFDAIRVKIRDEGFVRNKAVYIALAILADGTKQILGITQLVISNLRGPIPDEPEQTFLEVKEIPHFVRNGHYLIYLSRMPWFYSPVVLDGAYRIETVGTQEVLIDQTGHALNPRPTESAFLVGERVNPTSVFATRPLALKQLFETRIDLDDINAPQPMLPEVDEATVENAFDRAGYLDFVRGAMGKCVEPFTGSLAPSPEAGRVWDVVGVDELADPQIQSDSDVPCGSVDPETGETRVCK